MIENAAKSNLPSDGKLSGGSHCITLDNRAHLQINGVSEVIRFDEDTVSLRTIAGDLTVEGSTMHVSTLNIDRGEIVLDGKIDRIIYENEPGRKNGFFDRLLR